MSTTVPPTTPVKRNRVGNVDTDRLLARQAHLITVVLANSRTIESRCDFAMRAAELASIENELQDRGLHIPRRTLTLK